MLFIFTLLLFISYCLYDRFIVREFIGVAGGSQKAWVWSFYFCACMGAMLGMIRNICIRWGMKYERPWVGLLFDFTK